jgi:hypothetical protein
MTFAGFGSTSSDKFEGAILGVTASGQPGKAIATTSATTLSNTSVCCAGARTVKFVSGRHALPKGNYFAAVECANSPCSGGWNMEDVDMTGAAVDYWHIWEHETSIGLASSSCPSGTGCHTRSYTYSSPWHPSTYYPEAGAVYPEAGAVIIKSFDRHCVIGAEKSEGYCHVQGNASRGDRAGSGRVRRARNGAGHCE